jgi:Protein of unknown function (DUF938)
MPSDDLTSVPSHDRQYAPATDRNRDPILTVLQQVLPAQGTILEIASGTGQHSIHFAPALAPRTWQPSEPNPQGRASIRAWAAAEPAANLREPIDLDVCAPRWPVEVAPIDPAITAIVTINLIHIAPWAACLGLLAGTNRILPIGGVLYLYGPYKQQGVPLAPGNEAFDASLRSQNSAWGLRYLEIVMEAAAIENLHLKTVIAMPANNLSVVFEKV